MVKEEKNRFIVFLSSKVLIEAVMEELGEGRGGREHGGGRGGRRGKTMGKGGQREIGEVFWGVLL